MTAVDGSFHFPGVVPGRHRLSIAEGWAEAGHELELEVTDEENEVEVALRLATIGLRGRVLDATGLGLGGVAVTFEPLGRGAGDWATRATPKADAAGTFRLEHAVPGAYRLRAEHPAHGVAEQAIEVIEGVPIGELTLILAPPEIR